MAVTYTHRRSAWLRSEWASNSPPAVLGLLSYLVIHYPGCDCAPDGDPGELSTTLAVGDFLDRVHRATMAEHGHAFAYNSGHDWLGATWECRGATYRNAANAPPAWNSTSWSAFVITDIDGNMTPYAIASVRQLAAELREFSPAIEVVPHSAGRDLGYSGATPTACPSNRIRSLIISGAFDTPEDSMTPTLFLARSTANRNHVRRGNGERATLYRSNELGRLADDITAGRGPVYLNPLTRAPINSIGAVPILSESELDGLVGYLDRELTDRDEG